MANLHHRPYNSITWSLDRKIQVRACILLYPWIGTGIVEKNDKGFSEWSRIRVIANRCRPILRSAFEKPERFRHLMMLSAGDYPKAIPLESAMAACRRIEGEKIAGDAQREARAAAIAEAFRSERWTKGQDVLDFSITIAMLDR